MFITGRWCLCLLASYVMNKLWDNLCVMAKWPPPDMGVWQKCWRLGSMVATPIATVMVMTVLGVVALAEEDRWCRGGDKPSSCCYLFV
ncbi:hypothetical protein L1987_65729 [Smallanthus sonchifolius]|uniref:Uncharacterized protein n=1 Tax=Smallanthus sonchifolius TaxID=185202 RepID=A0ACB9BVG7_9ASTR|nr:hypothetical protein L1987_65729 [Smallanthus sonchifolius]